MKRRLIALRGPSNVGKSTTLRHLYRILVADPDTRPLVFVPQGRKADFLAVVSIGGSKVGLVNRGDVPAILKKLLNELARKHRCDVIVCAARSRGTVRNVLASFNPPHELVEVPKAAANAASEMISNLSAAYELASLVYAAIDA